MTVHGTFRQRAGEAAADERLRRAVRQATTDRDARRRALWAELPDADGLRDLARRIKDHALDNLDQYLRTFIESCERLGVHVHLASTAKQANEAVVRIARQHDCTRAAKSKSMLTEELELNANLIAAGIDVIETDLGEYLLQLDGDRPSHITAPAVHKDVAACAETFASRLGVPYVEDPEVLVQAARNKLRDMFRHAELAVTGANFAIAESGTIILVMNEGNGRFCTLKPRVHVAVLGIEKIVPTPADAAVLLKLLGRSATAQKMTIDTHFITGPKREGDVDGPAHMHVVIVDAGRTAMLGGKYRDVLGCIRCGACLNICPVYRAIGGHAYGGVYPGPIGKLLTALNGATADADVLPHASSLCGACLDACPVKIDIPRLLVSMRGDQACGRHPPRKVRLIRWAMRAMRTPRRYALAQRLMRAVLRRRAEGGWISRSAGPLAGWTAAQRDFPAPARKSFRRLWKEGRAR